MTRPHTAAGRAERAAESRARRAQVEDPAVVMQAAAAYLALRARTVSQTLGHLRRLGYPAALCQQVVDRLVEMAYLDDLAFARAWVASRDRSRPRGEFALRRELIERGVPDRIIEDVLHERRIAPAAPVDPDDYDPGQGDLGAAIRLLERRRATLDREADPRRRRQRAYALLARNGFDPEVCAQALAGLARDAEGPRADDV